MLILGKKTQTAALAILATCVNCGHSFGRAIRPCSFIGSTSQIKYPRRSMATFATETQTSDSTATSGQLNHYTDAHCHLFHEAFGGKEDEIAVKAASFGLEYCIVNGLDPPTNRQTLELCSRHDNLLAAVGIYPLDAACNVITPEAWTHDFPPPEKFNIEEEVAWIDDQAANGRVVAIGECGLDSYYLTDNDSTREQERVLRLLCAVAKKHDLPLILHSRKAELRTFEILQEEGITRADFHCYCGKVKLGKRIAEAGYYLSIPSGVERMDSFQSLAKALPMDRILTETDSPYMGPDKGERNDPSTVPRGVTAIAKAKGMDENEVGSQIRENFRQLFRV